MAFKNVISPDRRRAAVEQLQQVLVISERRACRVIGQPRSTQRYRKRPADEEEQLRNGSWLWPAASGAMATGE